MWVLGAWLGLAVASAAQPWATAPYLTDTPVQSRSISFENPTGAWGIQDVQFLHSGTTSTGPLIGMYRWHLKDPIYFKEEIRVTVQQIGYGQTGYFERSDDWNATAFWYEEMPSDPLPPLPAFADRLPDAGDQQQEPYQVEAAKVQPLPLEGVANMGIIDQTADDGTGGWTDQGAGQDLRNMPLGVEVYAGVPFETQDAAIVLEGENVREQFPSTSPLLAVGFPVKRLFFHLGAAWAAPSGTKAGSVVVTYADREQVEVPFIIGQHVNEWWLQQLPVSEGRFGWSGMSAQGGETMQLYVTAWENPHPAKPIQHLRFKSSGTSTVLGVVGVTAERP